jgi:hypothetical protein
MKTLYVIFNSHARALVPGVKVSKARNARSIVYCAKSRARSGSRVFLLTARRFRPAVEEGNS